MRALPRNRIRGGLAAIVVALVALVAAPPSSAQTPGEVVANPPGATIGATNTFVTMPVTLSRTSSTPVLGFSIRFQLSAEFAALNTGADIALGSFLTSSGATNMQVVANGGGVYTVDGVMLGGACGPTAQPGTLFTIPLRSTAPSATAPTSRSARSSAARPP